MNYPKQTDNYNVDIFNSNFRELAGNVISLDTEKFDKSEAQGLFKDVSFNKSNGVITFALYNGSVKTIDTLLEKIAVNFDFDRETQRLIITLDDGTEKYVDLSAFVTQYEFLDSETIAFALEENGKVFAKIKEGSIGEKHLRPDYLADIKVEAEKSESAREGAVEAQRRAEDAEAAAVAGAASVAENANVSVVAKEVAIENAKLAESYAVGTGNARPDEAEDNAKSYYEKSREIYDDVSNKKPTRVKGDAETEYRQGDVNITPEDIGIVNASVEKAGIVKPDGKTIKINDDGTIMGAASGFTGTAAEVKAAISNGEIEDGMIVNITDDQDSTSSADDLSELFKEESVYSTGGRAEPLSSSYIDVNVGIPDGYKIHSVKSMEITVSDAPWRGGVLYQGHVVYGDVISISVYNIHEAAVPVNVSLLVNCMKNI